MLRLVLAVALEGMVGVAIGGVLLAVLIPVLSHFGLIDQGNVVATLVITSVLVTSVGLMVLRPGSALSRYFER